MGAADEVKGVSSGGDPEYGTFQGVANYPPPRPPPPTGGFPQPVPPPGLSGGPPPPRGCQPVEGYAVAEGRHARRRLPCCGIGCGWVLFITGFFLGAIPWYVGLILLVCSRLDSREKPGYIACAIAAVLGTIAIVLGVTKGTNSW